MPISIDVLRVGRCYFLLNYGEYHEFEVMENLGENNFRVKDIHTLEYYELNDLIQFGKGDDYDMGEC
jgi:hypothetical protein